MPRPTNSVDDIYVAIRLESQKLKSDLRKIPHDAEKVAKDIEGSFRKLKIDINNRLLKMKYSEVQQLHKAFTQQLQKKIAMNADIASIEKTRIALREVESALGSVQVKGEQSTSKLNVGLKKLVGTLGVVFGVRQLFQFGKKAVQMYGEQEQSIQKLDTALNRHSQNLVDYASALQKVTTFGDEQIIEVQARIAAFVKEESKIKALTVATLDFANAKGIDLVSAGDLLAKTLGSSVNALARYGIEVTGAAGSTERLESITESIAKLWGGSALNAAKTQTGQLKQMNNELSDQEETLGKNLLPVWLAFTSALTWTTGTLIQAGRNIRLSFDNTVQGIENLLSGQISFWNFVNGQMETNEQRTKRLASLLISPHAGETTGANKDQELQLKSYTKIVKEIEELNERLTEENLSLEEAARITEQIAEKTKLITFTEKAKADLIDLSIQKIKNELELADLLNKSKLDLLISSKANLEALLATTTEEEKRLKLLREISAASKEIATIQDNINKGINNRLKDKTADQFFAEATGNKKPTRDELIKKRITDFDKIEDAEKGLIDLRFRAIENEYTQREVAITEEFDFLENKYQQLFKDNLISQTQLTEALGNIEIARSLELKKLDSDRWSTAIGAVGRISSVLGSAFKDSSLVQNFQKALEIAEAIAAVLQAVNILGTIFGGVPGGGAVAALKTGGEFSRGQVTPYNKIPKFAGGADFKVPSKYTNDSYLMRVSADEKVRVTPANKVGDTDRLLSVIADRVGAVSRNISALELKVELINEAPDVKTKVRQNKKIENRLTRDGINYND